MSDRTASAPAGPEVHTGNLACWIPGILLLVVLLVIIRQTGELYRAFRSHAEVRAARQHGSTSPAEATNFYRGALRLSPHNTGIREELIRHLRKHGELEAALKEIEHLSPASSRREEWSFARGELLLQCGLKKQAREAFQRVLMQNPAHWDALYNLLILHNDDPDLTALDRLCQTAVLNHPDRYEIPYLQALAHARNGEGTVATELFHQALSKNSTDPELLFNLALHLYNQRQYPAAETWCHKALQKRPTWTKAQQLVRKIEQARGKPATVEERKP